MHPLTIHPSCLGDPGHLLLLLLLLLLNGLSAAAAAAAACPPAHPGWRLLRLGASASAAAVGCVCLRSRKIPSPRPDSPVSSSAQNCVASCCFAPSSLVLHSTSSAGVISRTCR